MKVWKEQKNLLAQEFANTKTVKQMISSLNSHKESKRAKELLCTLMHQDAPYQLSESEIAAGEELAACGSVVMDATKKVITPSSPLIRQAVLFNIFLFTSYHM